MIGRQIVYIFPKKKIIGMCRLVTITVPSVNTCPQTWCFLVRQIFLLASNQKHNDCHSDAIIVFRLADSIDVYNN